jgi:hypothetical protein
VPFDGRKTTMSVFASPSRSGWRRTGAKPGNDAVATADGPAVDSSNGVTVHVNS